MKQESVIDNDVQIQWNLVIIKIMVKTIEKNPHQNKRKKAWFAFVMEKTYEQHPNRFKWLIDQCSQQRTKPELLDHYLLILIAFD